MASTPKVTGRPGNWWWKSASTPKAPIGPSGIAARWIAFSAALSLLCAPGVEAQATPHRAHTGPAAPGSAAPSLTPVTEAAPHGGPLTYGAGVPLGRGIARTYLVQAEDGSVELGVAISEDAVGSLPGPEAPGAVIMPDGLSTFPFELALPEPNTTPYRHVVLDWNPGGHEPSGLYDLPHIDFHFYLIESEARLAIDPRDPTFVEKAARYPEPALIPQGYFAPEPAAVPAMGVHWLDPASPELNGEMFSRTFLFGSWDGEVIFAEPMITIAYLETKPNVTVPVPLAERSLASGPLPAGYTVRWDAEAREYQVGIQIPPADSSSPHNH